MRIAVDAMGGDHAPTEIVRGAVAAARDQNIEIILVGREDVIEGELKRIGSRVSNVEVVHAPEIIAMEDQPAMALRKKKGASIRVATELVRSGGAQALISAGSTGAQMAAALLTLGRIEGVSRPAICIGMPTLRGWKLILDVGANVDCRPQHLVQFAHMGTIYAEKVLGMNNPTLGLLNVGTEKNKGNELTLAAFELLSGSGLNFLGNVEPRDVPLGVADVVVCDGFVGNCLLKFAEGMGAMILATLRQNIGASWTARAGAALAMPALRATWDRLDYSEYGGAPLLGVKGVSLVCHGSSKARAIESAIRVASQCVANNFVEELSKAFVKAS